MNRLNEKYRIVDFGPKNATFISFLGIRIRIKKKRIKN